MICKYCGKPVTGGICTSCKKAVSLSYTSHELSDMLGLGVVPPPLTPSPSISQEQLNSAYEEGFSSGKKQGYSTGWDAAQKDAMEKNKRKQRMLMIIAASTMVFLAVICSFAFNSIGFSRGYQQGKLEGKQEQKTDDEAIISEKLQSERQDGYNEGYRIGYKEGKAAGYQLGFDDGMLVTPSPATPTPSPTLAPIVLKMNSKGPAALEVTQLQQRLIELGFLEQNEDDGVYGPKTKKAIERFQEKNGVTPVDGSIVRQDLWDLIMSENAIPMKPIPTPTVEDYSEKPNSTPVNESSPTEAPSDIHGQDVQQVSEDLDFTPENKSSPTDALSVTPLKEDVEQVSEEPTPASENESAPTNAPGTTHSKDSPLIFRTSIPLSIPENEIEESEGMEI